MLQHNQFETLMRFSCKNTTKTNQKGLNMNTAKAILLASKRKSQVANYMMWLFLGGFGANSFYVGNFGMGIINILGTLAAMAGLATPNAVLWLGINACLLIVSIFMSHGQVDLINREIDEEILKAG